MSLLMLPTELLQIVIANCRPDGIEALVLTCKEIYETADSILDEHRFYRREYTNLLELVSFYARAKPGGAHYLGPNVRLYEPGKVTMALLEEPLAGQYINLLELASCSEDTFQMVEAETGGFEDISGRERLLPLIESSRYIKATEQYSPSYRLPVFLEENSDMPDFGSSYSEKHAWIWRTGILKGYRCAALGLLLTLAPNLRRFHYSLRDQKQNWYIGPVVQAAAADGSKSGILSKLEELEIHLGYFQIQELCPYLALPSIKKFKLMGPTRWQIGGDHYEWKYGTRTSTIEEIDVYKGDADSHTIGRFLQPLVKLRVFHWTHGCGYTDGCGCEDWDGNAFVQTIGKMVGWHLQELGLTFDHYTNCVSSTGIDHLLRFPTLKYLELDLQFLLGKSNLKRNKNPPTPIDLWLPRRLRSWQSMPCLIDVLPSSIENLRLWVTEHVLEPERMFEHIARLPNLKKITIAYYVPEVHYTRDGPPESFAPLPAHQFYAIAQDLEPFGIKLDVVGSRGPPGLWRRNCTPDKDHLYTPAEMLPSAIYDLDVDVNVAPV
ncbi:putative f-box domain protein [Venturia nashicola]|nr:putative f-box domain protein [Venturia nashicola]